MRASAWLLFFCLLTGSAAAQTGGLRQWGDYQVIMWISGKTVADPAKAPLVRQRLREMGVTAGMVTGDGESTMWKEGSMPFYVENIVRTGLCLKYRSPVTDWNKFVNQWMEKREESAFVRPYCLEDPTWLAESQKQMRKVAEFHRGNAPLLYDIRDELSVTTSANPFDYDFSPQSLAGFRKWLQEKYSSLETLNQQWETDFSSWEAVRPFSTDQIKARMVTGERMPKAAPDWSALKQIKGQLSPTKDIMWNFSPWCDFRSYMDIVLARTLDSLRKSARAVDPVTPVGIEGTQMPHAFGGYDLWKLSQSVDWMEPYDVANSREILGSFMPGKPLVCTLFEKDADHAMRRLWHLLLLGDKGCIVWWSEDCIDASQGDCPLTAKAKALAPVFREMQSPLARLFMRAERETDPIAIHYSQPSIQVAWLLESVTDGKTWPRRFSSFESQHNQHAAARNGWLKLLQDLGYTPRFVSTEQIEGGELEKGGYRVFVMPQSYAVTAKEAEAVKSWREKSKDGKWIWIASRPAGGFDGSGRYQLMLSPPSGNTISIASSDQNRNNQAHVEWGSGRAEGGDYDVASYPRDRVIESAGKTPDAYVPRLRERLLANLDFALPRPVTPPFHEAIRIHRYRLGTARLVAFERGVDYQMSEELKQAGGNESLERPLKTAAKLASKAHVYDLRTGSYLGERDEIILELDPWKPSLFAMLPMKLPEGQGVVEALLGK